MSFLPLVIRVFTFVRPIVHKYRGDIASFRKNPQTKIGPLSRIEIWVHLIEPLPPCRHCGVYNIPPLNFLALYYRGIERMTRITVLINGSREVIYFDQPISFLPSNHVIGAVEEQGDRCPHIFVKRATIFWDYMYNNFTEEPLFSVVETSY